jgi:hypothetical protein
MQPVRFPARGGTLSHVGDVHISDSFVDPWVALFMICVICPWSNAMGTMENGLETKHGLHA